MKSRFEKLLGVVIDSQLTLVAIFPKFGKQSVPTSMHSPEFFNTRIRIKGTAFQLLLFIAFNYSLLIWMNHNKSTNNKINNLHEKALKLTYCGHSSNFQELFQRNTSLIRVNTSKKYPGAGYSYV